MPQPKKGPSLGANPSHQRLMLANLAQSLFEHERIKTTEAKARLLRPYAERLITKAKHGTIHHRRQVLSSIENRDVVHKLFADIAPRFADRHGGYTRILKLGPRNGDGAPMALIELIEEGVATGGTGVEEGEDQGGRRRRLRAPRRRGVERERLPEDKPARSRAAQAAAQGSGADPSAVESPEHVTEEEGAVKAAQREQALEAHSEPDVPADTGAPPQRQETRSAQETKQD